MPDTFVLLNVDIDSSSVTQVGCQVIAETDRPRGGAEVALVTMLNRDFLFNVKTGIGLHPRYTKLSAYCLLADQILTC
jgi:hypothetical protein